MNRDDLIEVFQDTMEWCKTEELQSVIAHSIKSTMLYSPQEYPTITAEKKNTKITVTKSKTFEAAQMLHIKYPNKKIAVHNFASATNPGGGVTRGSRAQEECLCRCSTLYPVLNTPQLMEHFYCFHRQRQDVRYTDTCIYTPGIAVIKTDKDIPQRMNRNDWFYVDMLTCAAPNLRERPYNSMNPGSGSATKVSDEELLKLHISRAKHLMHIAAANGMDVLVLGAFGCGAFQNKPEIVAKAYKMALAEYGCYFDAVEFAVYCSPRDMKNYYTFEDALGKE